MVDDDMAAYMIRVANWIKKAPKNTKKFSVSGITVESGGEIVGEAVNVQGKWSLKFGPKADG